MQIIRRYVVVDTLQIFLTTLAIMVLVMTLGSGANEGLKRGLPPRLIGLVIPYLAPEMLRFMIPGCLLFAVCSVFGRMAAANEIVALKSVGVSALAVVTPVLAVAALLSVFTFWLYDVCATWSRPGLERVVVDSIDQIAVSLLKSKGSFQSGGLSFIVKDVDDQRLLEPVITIEGQGDAPPIRLTAHEARLECDPTAGVLRIDMWEGRLDVPGKASLRFSHRHAHEIPLPNKRSREENTLPPAELPLRAIAPQIAREQRLIAQQRARPAPPEATTEAHRDWRDQLAAHEGRLWRLQAEPHRRLANGLSCLCFVLLGAPVALWMRSADNVSTFFVCFLPILLLYYPLLVTGEKLAREGTFGPWPMWLANAVLLSAGGVLLWRYHQR